MGVACSTYCLDCNVRAPEIGDQGMLGQPSLMDEKDYNEDWGITSYNFGWIYTGLKAISLLPFDVEAYRAFLEAHQGHDILLTTDHDDEEPGIDWDKLADFRFEETGFEEAFFEMACPESGEVVTSSHAERFKTFDGRSLTDAEAELLLAKIFHSPDCFDAFHSPSMAIDPYGDLERFADFLRQHKGKEIVVRLLH